MAVTFVKVVKSGPRKTTVLASDGNTYTFHGNVAWRANNPGNLRPGKLTNSLGAIGTIDTGSNGKFLVFPDRETGLKAQETLQFETPAYSTKTIAQAIRKYAPAADNNNPDAYAARLAGALGVSVDTKMADLTPAQRAVYMQAQHGVEDNRPGTIAASDGQSVPSEVVQQFRGAPLPPMNITAVGTELDVTARRDGVAATQRQLQAHGFDPGPVDGVSGPKTKAAVKAFQQANGLVVDGIVGPKTQAALATAAPNTLGNFGGRLSGAALNGVDRLTPGKVTHAPTDFTTDPTGTPDPQLLTLGQPRNAVAALSGGAGAGTGAAGSATLRAAPPAMDGIGNGPGSFADLQALGGKQEPPPADTAGNFLTTLGGGLGNTLGTLGQQAQGSLNYLGGQVEKAGQQLPEVADKAKSAIISAAMMSPKARGAIIDPIISNVTNANPLPANASFADRQARAQAREALMNGTPVPQAQPRTITTTYRAPAPAQKHNGGGQQQAAANGNGGQTFKGSSTGRTYTVGGKYSNATGTYVATGDPNKPFQKVA